MLRVLMPADKKVAGVFGLEYGFLSGLRLLAARGGMELVMVALSGVQRFIGESRSTADLYAGSALMSELAGAQRDWR
jgi:hypothetical protein